MKERVEKLLGADAQPIMMGTFHSMCAILLRRHGKRIDLDTTFGIADTTDRLPPLRPRRRATTLLTTSTCAAPSTMQQTRADGGPARVARRDGTAGGAVRSRPRRVHPWSVLLPLPSTRLPLVRALVDSRCACTHSLITRLDPDPDADPDAMLAPDTLLSRISHVKSLNKTPSAYRASLNIADQSVRPLSQARSPGRGLNEAPGLLACGC